MPAKDGYVGDPRNRKTKVCSKCGIEKKADEFYRRGEGRHKGLLTSRCRQCLTDKAKEWAKDNPEKRKQSDRRYYQKYYASMKPKVVKPLPLMPPDDQIMSRRRDYVTNVHAVNPEDNNMTFCNREYGVVSQKWTRETYPNAIADITCGMCKRSINRRERIRGKSRTETGGVNHPAA
jgi:hypothetical protein